MTLWEEIVDGMNELSGEHPGYRAAHAKGVICRGTFTPAPGASELSRAAHLAGDPVDVVVRFSNGSGNPHARDTDRRDGRGMAVKFALPGGEATDVVSLSLPVFFVRTPEEFLEFLRARRPDPETGQLDMDRIGAFVAEHPTTGEALQRILPALANPPASYATCAYNGLHAFCFVDAAGGRRFGRYRWHPQAGEKSLAEDEIASAPRDFLQEEIRERLEAEPAAFTLELRLAGEGDPLDDPTQAWPEERARVQLGRLEVTAVDEEAEAGGSVVVFDPMRLTDGIEPSDDPILRARPHAYAVSVERRMAAAGGGGN